MLTTRPAHPLVRLRDVRQTLASGISGACIQFRTLDGVALDVRPRELLVLAGDPASGNDALLDILNGDRRGVTGSCIIAPSTRIQRARIAPAQAAAIVSAWPECVREPAYPVRRVAESAPAPLVLLDLEPPQSLARDTVDGVLLRAHTPVHHWVQSLVHQGGAAILAAGMPFARELAHSAGNTIRIIGMAHGRIISPPVRHRRHTTFHSRTRHSGPRRVDIPSACACQSSVSSTPSHDG